MDLGYSFPATFFKSGEESADRVPITIIPNAPSKDRQDDKIILKAFDAELSKSFVFDGVIDWDHQSMLAKSAEDRAKAIIGEPEKLYVDEKRAVPVCEGFLFKSNPYVRDAILPALKAGSNRFGASLGGRVLRKSVEEDPKGGGKVNVISKISLKHIAITPLQKAVHQGTKVELRKSEDGSEATDIVFPDFGEFTKSFQEGGEMYKALVAGSATDIAGIAGGQAIQNQSLEGGKKIDYTKIKHTMPFVIETLLKGELGGKYDDCVVYLMNKGYNRNEAEETVKHLARNGARIVKLVF